jgi:hypothetical protein
MTSILLLICKAEPLCEAAAKLLQGCCAREREGERERERERERALLGILDDGG